MPASTWAGSGRSPNSRRTSDGPHLRGAPMTADRMSAIQPLRIADARNAIRHVFIRDLCCRARSACTGTSRRGRSGSASTSTWPCATIAICTTISPTSSATSASPMPSVRWSPADTSSCWKPWRKRSRRICLEDGRVRSVRVRVEKLDIFPDASQRRRRNRAICRLSQPAPSVVADAFGRPATQFCTAAKDEPHNCPPIGAKRLPM